MDNFINIDSFTINKLYSEKNIKFVGPDNLNVKNERIIVNIKTKPINPKLITQGTLKNKISLIDLNIDRDFDVQHLSQTKIEFIKILLPLISFENQKVVQNREYLINIRRDLLDNKTLTNQELVYLNKLAKKYNVDFYNIHKIDLINQLLVSIDIIPNSIVLAQAANESGWGTSRFAREFNAIFGEYTYDFSKGVIPLKREKGKAHFIKAFSSFDKSVESYFKNINTHYAYEKFRSLRKLMREKNNFENTELLVEALTPYAEDDQYTDIIYSIINSNKLDQFDIISEYNTSKS